MEQPNTTGSFAGTKKLVWFGGLYEGLTSHTSGASYSLTCYLTEILRQKIIEVGTRTKTNPLLYGGYPRRKQSTCEIQASENPGRFDPSKYNRIVSGACIPPGVDLDIRFPTIEEAKDFQLELQNQFEVQVLRRTGPYLFCEVIRLSVQVKHHLIGPSPTVFVDLSASLKGVGFLPDFDVNTLSLHLPTGQFGSLTPSDAISPSKKFSCLITGVNPQADRIEHLKESIRSKKCRIIVFSLKLFRYHFRFHKCDILKQYDRYIENLFLFRVPKIIDAGFTITNLDLGEENCNCKPRDIRSELVNRIPSEKKNDTGNDDSDDDEHIIRLSCKCRFFTLFTDFIQEY